jgi:hypothetical protein
LENAKKKLVFHFGVGRHASFPQKPVVKKNTLQSCIFSKLELFDEIYATVPM